MIVVLGGRPSWRRWRSGGFGTCRVPRRDLPRPVSAADLANGLLEQHGGRTPVGVAVRVLQRILALTAAIWHNHKTGQPTLALTGRL
jgi:hypothetical protein